ncbi:Membrane carboxypeptidase (penicillin-binding protein) [Streptomyces sp. LamerLS-316]|uniref:transglycosylase domain-containing protein n=1 Tax=unclassified Streptomyces TaxID=2593676 RepID=UPI000823E9E6|nr:MULTISPECIES: transglycosylase domain-containing protein [unclassified Streptomyces]MYQ41791.1 penicillin-binding protein [Streptomyces sp. SID4921]SCK28353.1 Membrane carboxypeptidase (penicillin-binding protein) [Streptomyces sp. LamerLS-316]
MSEHRRKAPQPQGGGRAAARRAAQQPSGRRTDASRRATQGSPSGAHGEEPSYGGRAEARRAAQRGGGGRRRGAGDGPGHEGRGRGRGDAGKKRFIDYPRAGKYGFRRWVPSWKLVSGLCLGFLGLMMGAAGIAYALVVPPEVKDLATAQNNVYYWADNTQMVATGGSVNRQSIEYAQIPEAMRNAVISAENKSFEHDRGIDPMGIARAFYNMARGGDTQGGSTITQQYVKNSMLSQDQTLSRKFKELFITLKVGETVGKKKVMEGYLNVSYYGRGASGLQAAARAYYNKDATDLNESECAFLATLLKGASYYDPAGAPDIDPVKASAKENTRRAKERWAWILDEEVKDGRLSAAKRATFTEFPMPRPPQKDAKLGGQTGYLVDLATKYFLAHNDKGVTEKELSRGGYEIHTTFDKNKVTQLEKSIKKVYDAKIDPEKRPDKDTHVQFGGASVDTKTGAILATYGGQDATKHYTNNADATGAQVGSTFKPFVLAAAMQYGKRDPEGGPDQSESERTPVSPKSIYNGDNELKINQYNGDVWMNDDGKEWLQTNDGDHSYGDITLRYAMQESANSPYVQLGMDVGTDKVKQAAMDAGLRDDNYMANADVPSFSIGTSSPSAIRMAGAYSTFATSGKQREPFSVLQVKHKGDVIYQHKTETKSPFPSVVADNVTDVLKNVVENGTGTPAQLPGRDVAGKTGTTDGNKSAWFVGYTPQISTAISMFRMDDDETQKDRKFLEMYGTGGEKSIHGASFPAQIWHDYMSDAMKGMKVVNFPKPEPYGDTVFGGGAVSPSPTPSPTPSPSESSEEPTPSATPSSPSPSPSDTCAPLDWECKNNQNGGNTNGNDNGGTTDGTSDGGTDTGATNGGADTGTTDGTTDGSTEGEENGRGGIFGGGG